MATPYEPTAYTTGHEARFTATMRHSAIGSALRSGTRLLEQVLPQRADLSKCVQVIEGEEVFRQLSGVREMQVRQRARDFDRRRRVQQATVARISTELMISLWFTCAYSPITYGIAALSRGSLTFARCAASRPRQSSRRRLHRDVSQSCQPKNAPRAGRTRVDVQGSSFTMMLR